MKKIILGCVLVLSSCLTDTTRVNRDTGKDANLTPDADVSLSDDTSADLTVDTTIDTGADVDKSVFGLMSTSPEENETDVARDSVLSATFTQNILAQSLTDMSLILKNEDDVLVSGVTKFGDTNNKVVFQPDTRLDLETTYTATLDSELAGLAGISLGEDFIWSFTTAAGVWSSAETLDGSDFVQPDPPKVVFDSTGKGIAVWAQNDGNQANIWTSRFDGTWGSAEPIFSSTSDGASPAIAMDQNGKAVVIWAEKSGSEIWTNTFDGTSWSNAVQIEWGNFGVATSLRIAVDKTGKAMAVWTEQQTFPKIIFSYFDGFWPEAEEVALDQEGAAGENPAIAFDENGRAVLVFKKGTGMKASVYDQGWTRAQDIGSRLNAFTVPQVATDTKGNTIVVWNDASGIQSKFFDGTVWSVQTVEISEMGLNGFFDGPQIEFDAADNALVVWSQNKGNRAKVFSNRFVQGAWETTKQIEADDDSVENSRIPRLSINRKGEAMAIWQNGDALWNVWANRFNGESWGTATSINSNKVISARRPEVVIDEKGNASAIWIQAGKIWKSRYE